MILRPKNIWHPKRPVMLQNVEVFRKDLRLPSIATATVARGGSRERTPKSQFISSVNSLEGRCRSCLPGLCVR